MRILICAIDGNEQMSIEGRPAPPSSVINAALSILREAGGKMRLKVAGSSMSPLIRDGDSVIVECGVEEGPGLGDVIVRRHQGGLVVHRIVRVLRDGNQAVFITKGDCSTSFDLPTSGEGIIGRVTAIEASRPIDLTARPWRMLNPLMAAHSHLHGWACHRVHLAKRRLIGDRSSNLTRAGHKLLSASFSLLPRLAITILRAWQRGVERIEGGKGSWN